VAQLLGFDSILHIAASAIDVVVQRPVVFAQRSDDEARVRTFIRQVGLYDNIAGIPPAPSLIAIAPERFCRTGLSRCFALGVVLFNHTPERLNQGFKARITCGTHDVIDAVAIATFEQKLPTKTAITEEDNLNGWPMRSDAVN